MEKKKTSKLYAKKVRFPKTNKKKNKKRYPDSKQLEDRSGAQTVLFLSLGLDAVSLLQTWCLINT